MGWEKPKLKKYNKLVKSIESIVISYTKENVKKLENIKRILEAKKQLEEKK